MHINNLTALTAEEQDKVSAIMRNFDFHSVKRAMTKMNWKWGKEVPSLYEIISTAESLLVNAIQTLNTIETGGFTASYKDALVSLTFNIESKKA